MAKKKTRYYALSNLYTPKGVLPRNRVIKDDAFTPEQIEKLLKRGKLAELPAGATGVAQKQPEGDVEESTEVILAHLWAFTDDMIKDRSIEHLNIMAKDHIIKHGLAPMEPFEDLQEAVMFMTKDRPKTGA